MQTDKILSVFDPWYAHRVDSGHNLYRWYAVWLTQDLFGDWECWTAWGRIGRTSRQSKLRARGSREYTESVAASLCQRKSRRGYRRID